jgi:hypothetical protein
VLQKDYQVIHLGRFKVTFSPDVEQKYVEDISIYNIFYGFATNELYILAVKFAQKNYLCSFDTAKKIVMRYLV